MKFFVSKLYIWFERELQPRILTFENNKVNVITGSSSTGKSNIYSIIDYCLLSSRPNIVEPVINENARWYGLEFCINENFYAVARKKPMVDVIPSDFYLQNESFIEGFYPQNANTHINDGRIIFEKAFGYNELKNKFLYRSCFVFNALTESIITSPYEFLNYKFYGDDYYQIPENRKRLLESVLTPDMEEYDRACHELSVLNKKKDKFDNYNKILSNRTKEFQELLDDLIRECISIGLLDKKIYFESAGKQIKAIECILQENSLSLQDRKDLNDKLHGLKEKHIKKSLQLENVNRSQIERTTYIETLSQIADSLKPVNLLQRRAEKCSINMWTSHILNALNDSLDKIIVSKQQLDKMSFPDNTIKDLLQKELDSIDAEIGHIVKQKGSLYQQAESFKVIGKLDANINRLKDLWKKKCVKEEKNVEVFTEEDETKRAKIQLALEDFNRKRLTTIPNLNECIQQIYDGLQYMEHYESCYTRYNLKQERLTLNNGKSIINYDTIGSQSNYMFLHLCFFMGLHRYFFDYIEQTHVGQFLFIDQPSIPYYAGSDTVKTTDKEKLLDAFKAINNFVKYVIEEKKQQFQIILIEHAPESYWTGDNKLDYFVTRELFTNGNALIPSYILNPKETNEN